ncbi:MAG TPA: hypothetical protein VEA99_03330 [Gemmatimonadaceae bacterium]|nr:hypothetical protein [Gemmatimonadaceae bacterium]
MLHSVDPGLRRFARASIATCTLTLVLVAPPEPVATLHPGDTPVVVMSDADTPAPPPAAQPRAERRESEAPRRVARRGRLERVLVVSPDGRVETRVVEARPR